MDDYLDQERLQSDRYGNPLYKNPKGGKSQLHYEFGIPPSSIKSKARRKKKLCYICVIMFLVIVLVVSLCALVYVALTALQMGQLPQVNSNEVSGQIYIVNYIFEDKYRDILSEKSKQLTSNFLKLITNSESFKKLEDLSYIRANGIRNGSVILDLSFFFQKIYSANKLSANVETAFKHCLQIDRFGKTMLGKFEIAIDKTKFNAVEFNNTFLADTTVNDVHIDIQTTTTTTESPVTLQTVEKCEPITLPICDGDQVSYGHTAYPNYVGHNSQSEANAAIPILQFFLMNPCYPYMQKFVCSVLAPKCSDNLIYPPCREMCNDFVAKCGSSLPEMFTTALKCSEYPSQSSGLCVEAPKLPLMNVRLMPEVGPPGEMVQKGAVQIELYDDHWVPVCGYAWEDVDGDIICRQLNFSNVKQSWTQPDTSGLMTFINGVRCMGYENNIGECEIVKTGDTPMPCSQPAWLECENQPKELKGLKVGLTGGPTPNEGLLEVFWDGKWGTVCDDLFDINDAKVACVTMGFDPDYVKIMKNNTAYQENIEGLGILLDDLECTGDEHHIGLCAHREWGTHNCIHKEDIAISCRNPYGPSNLPVDNKAP